jgi:ATP-dependent Zn protease
VVFINQIKNQTVTDIPPLQENFTFIIIISILLLFIIILISALIVFYRRFSQKHKNLNLPQIDKQNERISTHSISNVYEDIDYSEFELHEYYDNTPKPNIYLQILNNTQQNEELS